MESISSFDEPLLTDKEFINTSSASKHFNYCPFFGRRLSFIRDVFAKQLFLQFGVWGRVLVGFLREKAQIVLYWPSIIPRREESHTQLPSQLVDWYYREIFTHPILYLHGGPRLQSTEKQVCSKLHLLSKLQPEVLYKKTILKNIAIST